MSILDDEETLLDTMGDRIKESHLWDNSEMNRRTGRTSRLINYYAEEFINMKINESMEIRDHHSSGNIELFNKLNKRLGFLTIDNRHYKSTIGTLMSNKKLGYTINKIRDVYNIERLLNTNKLIGKMISDFYTKYKMQLKDYDFTNTVFSKDPVHILFDFRRILISETYISGHMIYFDRTNLTLLYKK